MCTIRVVKPISVVNKLDYQELVTPVPELGSTTAQESITAQGALSIKPGSSKPKVGLRPELLLDSKTSSLLSLPFSSLCPTSPHFPVARDTSIVIFFHQVSDSFFYMRLFLYCALIDKNLTRSAEGLSR